MKIVVRMNGGLGNQLFQYAYSRYLMTLHPDSEIILDLREYDTYKIRKFEMQSMKLNESVSIYDKNFNYHYDFSRKLFHFFQYLYRKLYKKPLSLGAEFLVPTGLLYSGIEAFINPSLNVKSVYLYGYFQDIRVVEPIRDILINEFTGKIDISNKAKEYLKLIELSDRSIGISIRCGNDYIDSGWPVCSVEYYKKGIEILKKRHINSQVFIFADNINKVKKQFGFKDDVVYIEECTTLESLELLAKCDDFVISNSSFAWWGSYLAQNQDKLIIVPQKWFVGLNSNDTSLVINKHMLILD